MSEAKPLQCCCCNLSKKNEDNEYRRTIRHNEKLDHWNVRNSSVQMNSILTPDNYELPKSECSCDFVDIQPDEVTKTNSKIKWGAENKKTITHSRYHQKCFSKKPKPKLRKPSIKRNIVPSTNCCHCGDGVDSSRIKFKNECYCSFPPDKPFLPCKPVITKHNPKRTIRSGIKSADGEIESSRTFQTLQKAKTLLHGYIPESEFLRRLQKEAKEVYDCQCSACKIKEETTNLKFTTHRHLLEEAYKDVDKHSLDELARHCHDCNIKSRHTKLSSKNSPLISSPKNSSKTSPRISSPKNSSKSSPRISSLSPKTSTQYASLLDCDKINTIKQIRNNNYFDTHSTNISLTKKNFPEHTCIHRFTLDNRLLPKPLNADNFGVSCCTVCNKQMKRNSAAKKSEEIEEEIKFIDYTKLSSVSSQPKERKFSKTVQISPRQINIASKNDVVELKVPLILMTDRKEFKLNKLMVPTNTWALRYQKGVI